MVRRMGCPRTLTTRPLPLDAVVVFVPPYALKTFSQERYRRTWG